MKGKHVILGLLNTRGGLTGYQIKEIVQTQLHHFYDGGFGMIYPTLKKLEEAEMVSKETISQDDKPNKNVFYITDLGKTEFNQAVNQKTEPEVLKSDFLMKLYFGASLDSGNDVTFLKEELVRKQASLQQLVENVEKWRNDGMSDHQLFTVEYGMAYYRAAIEVIEKRLAEIS